MKKSAALILPFILVSLLFSCGSRDSSDQNASAGSSGDLQALEVVPSDQSPLISSGDVDFLPGEPILSDTDILKESPVSEMDMDALLRAVEEESAHSEQQLRASVDYSALTTNYFDADAVDTGALRAPESVGALKIVDFGPVGRLPIEMRRPAIYVQFNQPMVPVSKLGEPMREHSILKMSPEVPGVYRWYGTKTLSFEPDAPIHRQSSYTVSINPGAKSIYGRVLGQPFEFVIESEPPEILSIAFGPGDDLYDGVREVPPTHSSSILLTFNQTIDAGALQDYISLVDEAGRSWPVTVSSPEPEEYHLNENFLKRSALIQVGEEPAVNGSYTLTVAPGYRTAGDASPTVEPLVSEFKTVTPFRYSGHNDRSYTFPYDPEGVMNPVYLEFSHPVDPESVAGNLSVSFEGIDAAEHIKTFGDTVRIANLPVEYESSYTVTITSGIRDIYGRQLLLADSPDSPEAGQKTIKVEVPAAISYSYFPGWDGLAALEAQFDPAVIYEFQNIDKGSFRINGTEQDLALDDAPRNQAVYSLVDLKPWMNSDGFGTVNLNWNFTERQRGWDNKIREYEKKRNMDVQVTDMGITTRFAYNKILVWVNSLSTGGALEGADITLTGPGGSRSALTDARGLAVVDLEDGEFRGKFYNTQKRRYDLTITAIKGGDRADLKVSNTQYAGRFGISSSRPEFALENIPRIFLFSDRGIYRPGETLTFRGVDWNQRLGEFTPYEGSYTISIMKREGYQRKQVRSWRGTTTSSGGFYDTYTVPEDMDPGDYYIRYERGGKSRDEHFQVANFRRLNFQVELKTPDRNFFLGDTIAVPLEASYLAGGPLAGGDISYYWTRKPLEFRPSGERWKFWSFGPVGWEQERNLSSDSLKLSLQGEANLEVETSGHSLKGKAYRYVVEATVEDLDRQAISASTSAVVHPASWYIGMRTGAGSASYWGSRFVSVGKDILFSLAQVGPDGRLRSADGKVSLEMIKGSWQAVQQKNVGSRINTRYEWVEESVLTTETEWKDGEAAFTYTPEKAGSYRLRATAADPEGREVISDISFYASGGSWVRWAGGNREDITLEPEQDLYFPGDTARILVKTPLEKGRYLMTIEREGILDERFVDLDPSNPIIEIPVKEEWVPVMYITLSSFLPRSDLPDSYYDPDFGKPKGIFGATALNISTRSRELDLEITPDKAVYRPGEKARVSIRVTENGRPVQGAEVSYLAVDRGILDLINYHIPNPLHYFYSRSNFMSYGAGDDSRRLLLNPVTYETSNLRGGDGEESKLQRRDDFTPLAVFEPFLLTDEEGMAVVELEWPDTLTTYRSTAIALKDQKIGYSEDELFVRNPLNVRAALPRQMRVRDTSFAGVVISNIDGEDHDVTVRIRADGMGLPGETEKTVTVPAGRAFEVPFVIEAKEAGESEIVFTVLSDVLKEELVQTLKVSAPVITESMTTTGIVEGDETLAEEALLVPGSIGEGYGSLQISLDSTQAPFLMSQLRTLTNHKVYDFTFDYLYAASAGIISPDLLELMDPTLALSAAYNRNRFLTILADRQNEDGGIRSSGSLYNRMSSPYLSLVSFHMLQLVDKQGIPYNVDNNSLNNYLRREGRETGSLYFNVYLRYIETLGGKIDKEETDLLLKSEDELGISGYALLGAVCEMEGRSGLAKELYGKVKNFVSIGTRTVDIRDTYETRFYFDSGYQQLAHLLNLGVLADEGPEMLRRYAATLDTQRGERNWINAQDRIWMAVALSSLISNENPGETDFRATADLSGTALMSEKFEGLSQGAREENFSLFDRIIPLSPQNELSSLKFEKEGEGILYYTTTLNYALPGEIAPARDEGLALFTQIETLDGEIVDSDNLELGGSYRMRVFLNSSKSRSYVNLSVPIPSGAEIVDPSLSVSSSYSNKGGVQSESWTREEQYGDETTYLEEGYIWQGLRFPNRPNQLIYDNEIRYSWDYLYYGQREVSFIFRCTTPGVYPTPPASASLLFEPEVFGRGRGRLIVVR